MDGEKRRGFSTNSIDVPVLSRLRSRKGQVTIFIIIGIVILFVFAGVLYLMKTTIPERLTADGAPIIASVPAEFQPIQVYTDNCLRSTAVRGLKLLGQQGGHIYPELAGKYTFNPTEADGILLGSLPVPYWYYKQNPSGEDHSIYTSLQPKLSQSSDPVLSVEAQLNRFVRERLFACLNAYRPFVDQGFAITVAEENVKISTTVMDETVRFLLELPVLVKRGSAERELTTFFVEIPLPLKQYFDVASQITKAQQDVRFLERQGMELVSIYSRKDSRYLAPITGDGYDLASTLVWSEANLKKTYTNLLTSYVPMLQFLGSANFYYAPISGILTQKVTDNAVLTMAGADDIDISFNFVPSDIHFKTNSQNGVLSPNNALVSASIFTFGFQEYDTHYDISYPVLVTLRDENVLEGEDYIFNFALESNIRNNEPAPAGKPDVERAPVPVSSIVCNPEQRDTGLLKTVVVDSYTKEPVEAVRIGFTIPDQTDCQMGLTDKEGVVEEKYPAVYGGVVTYLKPGYLTNFYPIDTYRLKEKDSLIGYAVADTSASKVVELDRLQKISINAVKRNVEKCVTPLVCEYTTGEHALLLPYKDISCSKGVQQCFFPSGGSLFGAGEPWISIEAESSISKHNDYYLTQGTSPLAADEEVLVTLERVKGLRNEVVNEPFVAAATVKGLNLQSSASAPRVLPEVQLVPGVYRVSVQAIKKSNVIIPENERCFAYDILTVTEQKCFTLSSTTMESYLLGGYEWNSTATYLTITPEMLYPSTEITFSVPVQNIGAIPETISTVQNECGGFLCAGGGCLFEGCTEKNIVVPALVVEDVQVPGEIAKKASEPAYRNLLKPTFK